eukprot:scaffold77175_cov53-Phaeocystis_antarctica.AAC.5
MELSRRLRSGVAAPVAGEARVRRRPPRLVPNLSVGKLKVEIRPCRHARQRRACRIRIGAATRFCCCPLLGELHQVFCLPGGGCRGGGLRGGVGSQGTRQAPADTSLHRGHNAWRWKPGAAHPRIRSGREEAGLRSFRQIFSVGELFADLAKQHAAMAHEAYAAPLHRFVRAALQPRERHEAALDEAGSILMQLLQMQPRCEQDEGPFGVGDVQTIQGRVVHKVEHLRIREAAISSELPHRVREVVEAKRLEEGGQVSLGRSSELGSRPSRLFHPVARPQFVLQLLEERKDLHHFGLGRPQKMFDRARISQRTPAAARVGWLLLPSQISAQG